MLTPIEDLDFSHDTEQDDDELDDREKVYAKFTAQWYVDPNDPEGLAWQFESPGYVLREREVFLDGVCSVIKERDGDIVATHQLPPEKIVSLRTSDDFLIPVCV